MKSPGTPYEHFKRKCIVYDVLEPDPTKKVIGIFENMHECAKFLGIQQGHVSDLIKNKYRNRTNKLNKTICIR